METSIIHKDTIRIGNKTSHYRFLTLALMWVDRRDEHPSVTKANVSGRFKETWVTIGHPGTVEHQAIALKNLHLKGKSYFLNDSHHAIPKFYISQRSNGICRKYYKPGSGREAEISRRKHWQALLLLFMPVLEKAEPPLSLCAVIQLQWMLFCFTPSPLSCSLTASRRRAEISRVQREELRWRTEHWLQKNICLKEF